MQQESVWDYPRPPRLEAFKGNVRIIHEGIELVNTNRAMRILETSHPPTFYLPPEDIAMQYLHQNAHQSFCEFKGSGRYYDLKIGGKVVPNVAWFYPGPAKAYAALAGYPAFYASKLDQCFVNDELVQSQEGDFYGGWITSNIKGPFKGGPGTWGW